MSRRASLLKLQDQELNKPDQETEYGTEDLNEFEFLFHDGDKNVFQFGGREGRN